MKTPCLQLGQQLYRLGLDLKAPQVDVRNPELHRDGLRNLIFRQIVVVNQNAPEQLTRAFLFGQCLIELLRSKQALLQQGRAQLCMFPFFFRHPVTPSPVGFDFYVKSQSTMNLSQGSNTRARVSQPSFHDLVPSAGRGGGAGRDGVNLVSLYTLQTGKT